MNINEVKSTVNALEKSPSKSAGGSTTHTSMSPGGANSASGSTSEFHPGCFAGKGGKKKY